MGVRYIDGLQVAVVQSESARRIFRKLLTLSGSAGTLSVTDGLSAGPTSHVDDQPSIRDLNVPRCAFAVAAAENAAAEDLLMKSADRSMSATVMKCVTVNASRGASHSSFVRFVRCSLTTPNPMNSAHLGGWPTLA